MNTVLETIKNSGNVAILPHVSADGDAIGSCAAMAEFVKSIGARAVVYTEENVEKRLEFIGCEYVRFDGEYAEHDLCIVLDCGDEKRIGERIAVKNRAKTVINIDHHKTNTYFGDINIVRPDASATGEILAELFCENGVEINLKAASALYAAIASDTGRFAYTNVSPKTFRLAAWLLEKGINLAEITRLMFESNEYKGELLKAEVIKGLHIYFGGKVKLGVCTQKMLDENGLKKDDDLPQLVEIPRCLAGTEIAVSLREKDGKLKCSLRSNGDEDVSVISLVFGGGGHAKAAGFTVEGYTIDELEEKIITEIKTLTGWTE